MNFNFPETPPYTPPRDSFLRYLQPTSSSTPNQDNFLRYLHPSSHFIKPQEPRETSFLFSDGTKPESLSPLRNKLKNIAPLPSRPTIDNFARPITQMTDEKNNTIAITPKRPVPKIEETNLSEQLQSIFPDADQTIKQEFGRFPGSQKLVSISKVNLPYFLKTDMPISAVDLHKKFVGTDAKALASIHALAALNMHFGGNKYISQTAIGEYLQNLNYQALSQENDKVFMSFDNIGLLVNDLLEQFVRRENNEIDKASVVSEKINNKLKTNFQSVLSPEMKIQKGEEDKEVKTTPKSIDVSTPLNRLEEFYETEKETFLKTALTINQTDLETATDAVDADSEALFEEMVNPTPG